MIPEVRALIDRGQVPSLISLIGAPSDRQLRKSNLDLHASLLCARPRPVMFNIIPSNST